MHHRRTIVAIERPKPYKRMIAFVAIAAVVAFALVAWYSFQVHPGDAKPAAPASTSASQ
jgi:hypothetical protein